MNSVAPRVRQLAAAAAPFHQFEVVKLRAGIRQTKDALQAGAVCFDGSFVGARRGKIALPEFAAAFGRGSGLVGEEFVDAADHLRGEVTGDGEWFGAGEVR